MAEAGADETGLEPLQEESKLQRPAPLGRAAAITTPDPLSLYSPAAAAPDKTRQPASSIRSQPARSPQSIEATDSDVSERATPSRALRFDSIEALLPAILDPRRAVSNADSLSLRDDRDQASRSDDENAHETAAKRSGDTAPHRDSAATQPSRTGPAGRAPINAAPAVPDVHIHIGRVELTAIQAQTQRPAPRREEKKPMSLEEYLRQRDGRRN
jgi:hypothetical protein